MPRFLAGLSRPGSRAPLRNSFALMQFWRQNRSCVDWKRWPPGFPGNNNVVDHDDARTEVTPRDRPPA